MNSRPVAAGDSDAVAALWSACGLGGGSETDRAEIAERLREDDGFFRCVELDGSIVGVVMGCYDNHRGWVKRMAVHPDRQGEGLGQKLVADLEATFLEAGITKLRMAVWTDNARGGQFWESQGYTELEDIRYFTKSLES